MFDPVYHDNRFKIKMQKRDAITHEIIRFLSGEAYDYLQKYERDFIDSLAEKKFKLKEYRISNKQLKWLIKIAYRVGFKNNDLEYWKDMENYLN